MGRLIRVHRVWVGGSFRTGRRFQRFRKIHTNEMLQFLRKIFCFFANFRSKFAIFRSFCDNLGKNFLKLDLIFGCHGPRNPRKWRIFLSVGKCQLKQSFIKVFITFARFCFVSRLNIGIMVPLIDSW